MAKRSTPAPEAAVISKTDPKVLEELRDLRAAVAAWGKGAVALLGVILLCLGWGAFSLIEMAESSKALQNEVARLQTLASDTQTAVETANKALAAANTRLEDLGRQQAEARAAVGTSDAAMNARLAGYEAKLTSLKDEVKAGTEELKKKAATPHPPLTYQLQDMPEFERSLVQEFLKQRQDGSEFVRMTLDDHGESRYFFRTSGGTVESVGESDLRAAGAPK